MTDRPPIPQETVATRAAFRAGVKGPCRGRRHRPRRRALEHSANYAAASAADGGSGSPRTLRIISQRYIQVTAIPLP